MDPKDDMDSKDILKKKKEYAKALSSRLNYLIFIYILLGIRKQYWKVRFQLPL
jgi:hypothetical protein